jgi:hypothetical protein
MVRTYESINGKYEISYGFYCKMNDDLLSSLEEMVLSVLMTYIIIFDFLKIMKPFEACFDCCRDVNRSLESFVVWPRECGKAIQTCSSACPAP